MDDASRPRPEHVFVNPRVAPGADDKQFDVEIRGKANDVAYRMASDNVGSLSPALFG
jgi:hypothetical protein